MDEILRWLNSIPAYLQSVDMKSMDWSLVISILALSISLCMAVLYQTELSFLKKQLRLDQSRYDEEQQEKKRKALQISIQRLEKYEDIQARRLKWVGIWLIVSNRSGEDVLLKNVNSTLYFSRVFHPQEGFFRMLSKALKDKLDKGFVSFSRYEGWVRSSIDCDTDLSEYFYLVDWETKQHIKYAPRNPYRLPAAAEKKIWYLFGLIPEKEGKEWMEKDYSLSGVRLAFYTDQGERIVTEDKIASRLSEDSLEELTMPAKLAD